MGGSLRSTRTYRLVDDIVAALAYSMRLEGTTGMHRRILAAITSYSRLQATHAIARDECHATPYPPLI